jgi:peroxiredoxin family protein
VLTIIKKHSAISEKDEAKKKEVREIELLKKKADVEKKVRVTPCCRVSPCFA